MQSTDAGSGTGRVGKIACRVASILARWCAILPTRMRARNGRPDRVGKIAPRPSQIATSRQAILPTLRATSTYRLINLPAAMTGPVGWPVGEPPGGSSETASVASGVTRPARSAGISSLIG
jgi:hypothetical protein